jgi:transposase
LTLVYQIDHTCKRLLWIGHDRTAATFSRFFEWLGPARCQQLKFVTSDMWRAFISTVAKKANSAVHVLDRFHVMRLFSDAVDRVRRDEARRLRAQGDTATLKHTRWILLKRKENLDEPQFCRLNELMKINYATTRAYLLKESFQQFWQYKSAGWAGKFLDLWVKDATWSRLKPFAKLACTIREHRDLLLNWFKAREAFAAGAVEGFNLKARVTTRMAYGFRSYDHAETALYHRLGNLPEPDCGCQVRRIGCRCTREYVHIGPVWPHRGWNWRTGYRWTDTVAEGSGSPGNITPKPRWLPSATCLSNSLALHSRTIASV